MHGGYFVSHVIHCKAENAVFYNPLRFITGAIHGQVTASHKFRKNEQLKLGPSGSSGTNEIYQVSSCNKPSRRIAEEAGHSHVVHGIQEAIWQALEMNPTWVGEDEMTGITKGHGRTHTEPCRA